MTEDRDFSAQEYVHLLRRGFARDPRFGDLEFAFDAGGMIRGAMNEGKSTPINVRITGKQLEQAHAVAEAIKRKVAAIDGVVDARIIQRLDYPEYIIDVDRAKAADLGLTQRDVMKNVVAAFNSSHPVQQEELLDRPEGRKPVLRRRAVPRGGHQVDRDAAGHRRSPARCRSGRSRWRTS